MVVHKSEQLRLQSMVTETLSNLCRNGLNFRSEFCIEGLLGITLDNDDIFLINIKETVTNDSAEKSAEHRDLCDLTNPIPLSVADHNFLVSASNGQTTLDFSKTGLLYDKSDKQDAFQLNALDLNISSGSYGKLSDLDILFDLSTTPGRKKEFNPMDMSTSLLSQAQDMSTSFLGQAQDMAQILDKAQMLDKEENKEEEEGQEDSQGTDCDLVLVKEEGRLRNQSDNLQQAIVTGKQDLPLVSLDATSVTTQPADSVFLNLKGDDQLVGFSNWEGIDALPLNLSDPQDPEPQDLSTNTAKQKSKHCCDVCSRKFRTESGLQKHKDKEHPNDVLMPQALPLIREASSQPLDLTIGRGENDIDAEIDHELILTENEPFTCICSKVISDYESYVDHVTSCSKSKLTPCKSCEICGKYFFSNSGYVKHKRLHIGSYKFHCSICHKGFFDRTHMSAHMDSSHIKVRRYTCEFCNKSFFWKHHLKRHKTTCDKAKVHHQAASVEDVIADDINMDITDGYSEGQEAELLHGGYTEQQLSKYATELQNLTSSVSGDSTILDPSITGDANILALSKSIDSAKLAYDDTKYISVCPTFNLGKPFASSGSKRKQGHKQIQELSEGDIASKCIERIDDPDSPILGNGEC